MIKTEIRPPMVLLFRLIGKTLKLSLDNGKAFQSTKVLSYRKLNVKLNDFPIIVYRLKIIGDGFETYAILSNMFTSDSYVKALKIPLLSKEGEIIGYTDYLLIDFK